MKVLMLCLGNICRSPTAAAILRHKADARGLALTVDSCGTSAFHAGRRADVRSIAHAQRRGYDLRAHRARQLCAQDFVLFDRIFAMDQENARRARALCPPEHAHKLALWLDVMGEPGQEVPDPWAGDAADFEQVLDLCERAALHFLSTRSSH